MECVVHIISVQPTLVTHSFRPFPRRFARFLATWIRRSTCSWHENCVPPGTSCWSRWSGTFYVCWALRAYGFFSI